MKYISVDIKKHELKNTRLLWKESIDLYIKKAAFNQDCVDYIPDLLAGKLNMMLYIFEKIDRKKVSVPKLFHGSSHVAFLLKDGLHYDYLISQFELDKFIVMLNTQLPQQVHVNTNKENITVITYDMITCKVFKNCLHSFNCFFRYCNSFYAFDSIYFL